MISGIYQIRNIVSGKKYIDRLAYKYAWEMVN